MAATVSIPVHVKVTVGSDILDLEDRELFLVLRRKWGLTQDVVAAEVGTNQPWLSRWERGREVATDEQLECLWTTLLKLVAETRAAAAETAA